MPHRPRSEPPSSHRSAQIRSALTAALLGGAFALSSAAAVAHACSPAEPYWVTHPWGVTDPDDTTAPTTAPVISVQVERTGDDRGCRQSDCPAEVAITVTVEEAAGDDRTEARGMAYRVEAVSGESPFPDQPLLTQARDDSAGTLSVSVASRSVDVRLRVVPVDAGGNDGPPSNEVRARSDGDGCSTVSSGPANLAPLALVLSAIAWRRRRRTGTEAR